ncbi:MAG: TonB-dependent receptor [Alteromonadaceae bacterium]|uniref:TonB-dependent receptor n=1 Tax=Paraglaciecola chathamensis TaxID=368405 RepID=UPI000C667316|nr:TonB-dependent receptor [Paraglaciecola agarilytica]MBN25195.1 TonB-dependent receptor [Alteromonadaceae bacterium]|tara:strand:+ start:10444 stop:13500 length:3057 start_codon:yes stop_codon:yes gene_type:complete
MKRFKPNLITAALLASCSTLIAGGAFAQQSIEEVTKTSTEQTQRADKPVENEQGENAQGLERIEVRGFATSLIQSLNQKRFSDTVSEQISADDLGGLPDVSMADALTRLPGISAVRTGGQAAEINIRGMSGDFVFSTLNGREQVSTSGSRSIEFDQYPSELISSAAVYKSPKASLIEGGVAGSVELQTASPLSNDKQHTFNVNARGMFNDRAGEVSDAEEFGHRLSLSYQGKYLDDTLGVALGYARLFQPSVSTQFVGLAYNATKDVNNDGDDEFLSEGFELQHKGGEETRDGYMAAIEWTPVDTFTLTADAFLSKFDSEEFARGFRVKLGGASAAVANPILNDNAVIGGTFNRTSQSFTRVELVNDDNQDYDQVSSFGINADWQATDNLTLAFDVSQSIAKSDFRNGLLWALVGEDANADLPVFDSDISISYLLHGLDLPDVGFSQAEAFTDLDRVMVTKYGIYPYENEDELNAYRFDMTYEFDDNAFLSSIEFGARYSDREYSNDRSVFEYGSDSSFSASQPPLRLTDDMVEVVDWEGDFSYLPSYLSIDLNSALNAWFPAGIPQPVKTWGTGSPGVINGPGEGPNTSWTMLESGKVFEKVQAAYIMANIDTELFGVPVTGNVGVRMVDTEQSSTVLQDVSEDIIDPETGEVIDTRGNPENGAQYITDDAGLVNDFYRPALLTDKYRDYLPSINLNFKLTDSDQLRFAAAKVLGRAPINRLFANATLRVEDVQAFRDQDTGEIVLSKPTAIISGSATNSPYLRPFYADQYDISYEKYFEDTDGAFIAALFYKDIKSFINTFKEDPFDFTGNGFTIPTEITVLVTDEEGEPLFNDDGSRLSVQVPTENGGYETAVNNDKGGYIRGAELSYTQIYSFLPDLWSGLGMSASYSYTESEIQTQTTLGGASVEQTLPGLSENVVAATLFWEYEDFETRLSVRWRDAFVSKQVAVNEQVVNFDSETVIDYQASYNINENLGMLFQVNNLTDEPTKSYFGSEAQTGTIQYFGRQIFLGVTYSL